MVARYIAANIPIRNAPAGRVDDVRQLGRDVDGGHGALLSGAATASTVHILYSNARRAHRPNRMNLHKTAALVLVVVDAIALARRWRTGRTSHFVKHLYKNIEESLANAAKGLKSFIWLRWPAHCKG